jgi:hypothetical protein
VSDLDALHASRGSRGWRLTTTVLALLLLVPAPVPAQVTLGARIGALWSSNLVRDSIVTTVTARPRIAPLVALRVEIPLRDSYRIAGELAASHSTLMSYSPDGDAPVTGLTVLAPALAIRVPATPWLTGEARLGAVLYAPSRKTGTLFSAGSPIRPTLGLGLSADRPLGRLWGLAIAVQYDVHKFTTTALRAQGFVDESVVHRVAIMLALSRHAVRNDATR